MRSKLRHPIRSIREPFGTAGLIVACVALIAALGGSAIAAGKLTSKQKKEVEKIAKKYAGKPGAPGAPGPAGPAGAKGDAGTAGANGGDGTNGTNGTNGVSPTGTQFSGAKGGCSEGGVEFKGANTAFACNGAKGANGQTGFTKTLPPGETETGNWSLGTTSPQVEISTMSVSFNIPYPDEDGPELHFLNMTDPPSEDCEGSVAEPSAAPGQLCFYEAAESSPPNFLEFSTVYTEALGAGANPNGAVLLFRSNFLKENSENETIYNSGFAFGTWAVTAPTSP